MPNRNLDPKTQKEPILQQVLKEMGVAEQDSQRIKNEQILKNTSIIPSELEKNNTKLIAYITRVGAPNSSIIPDDIAPFGSMLASLGQVENLDLLIHSPGGNGPTAEKIVEMCRQCCSGKFRVIVPNMAKSAATLIALGADEIVMGYCSELGPIDPQKIIVVGGNRQQVSAKSFIQAQKKLQTELEEASKKGENVSGYLQQLASSSMDPAFIYECQREVDFAIDFVQKKLPERMLKAKFPALTKKEREDKAKEIAENLTSTDSRFIHGRMIGAAECEQLGLNVINLSKNDPYWEKIFELYVRADVFLMINSKPEAQAGKLFMDGHTHLVAY